MSTVDEAVYGEKQLPVGKVVNSMFFGGLSCESWKFRSLRSFKINYYTVTFSSYASMNNNNKKKYLVVSKRRKDI